MKSLLALDLFHDLKYLSDKIADWSLAAWAVHNENHTLFLCMKIKITNINQNAEKTNINI